jgi:hypothetical protein
MPSFLDQGTQASHWTPFSRIEFSRGLLSEC